MDDLLDRFKNKAPEIIFEWNDALTNAEGWVVINSLRNGAAGGGTRMRSGLDRHEVESLAKVMEIKFTVSGPPIGGAKSGINFDPNDPRKDEVLQRWFKAVTPLLKNYYGTGGDLNLDEVKEVIPYTENYGLWHPQEGIVNGHFQPTEREKILLIGQLRQGVSKKLEDPRYSPDITQKYTVADMTTGYGVAQSVKHYYDLFRKESLEGKRVLVQGFGNVAGGAAYYLAQEGAKITGIIDKDAGIVSQDGLGVFAIRTLLQERKKNKLQSTEMIPFEEIDKTIWDQDFDIFIPAAASRLITESHVSRLIKNGLEVIACGANAPFIEGDVFFGKTTEFVDQQISLIPDFVANCGMARIFAYLMTETKIEITDEAIFNDISETIYRALEEVHKVGQEPLNLTRKALDLALNKLI